MPLTLKVEITFPDVESFDDLDFLDAQDFVEDLQVELAFTYPKAGEASIVLVDDAELKGISKMVVQAEIERRKAGLP